MFVTQSRAAAARRAARHRQKLRREMPYGCWRCADGRVVLFNRQYQPIAERLADGTCRPADPAERVPFVSQQWFYRGAAAPWLDKAVLKKCQAILAEFTPS